MTKGMIMVLCGLGGIAITVIIAIILLLSWEKRKKDHEISNKDYGKRNTMDSSNNASINNNIELENKFKLIEEDTVLLEVCRQEENNTVLLDENNQETELLNEDYRN